MDQGSDDIFRCGFSSMSPDDTWAIAKILGEMLDEGDVVLLAGELGAGKTVFAQGLAEGLGVEEQVTSPTFTIVKEYSGRLPLYHMDLYRIGGEALCDLGYTDYMGESGVTVVEWSERMPGKVYGLYIQLHHGSSFEERLISVEGLGQHYRGLAERWCNEVSGS